MEDSRALPSGRCEKAQLMLKAAAVGRELWSLSSQRTQSLSCQSPGCGHSGNKSKSEGTPRFKPQPSASSETVGENNEQEVRLLCTWHGTSSVPGTGPGM